MAPEVTNMPPASLKSKRLVAKRPMPLLPVMETPSSVSWLLSEGEQQKRDTSLLPHLYLKVSDAKGAALFYRTAFGVEQVFCRGICRYINGDYSRATELDFIGYVLVIYDSDIPVKPDETRAYRDLIVGDPDRLIAQAVSFGAKAVGEIIETVRGRMGRIKDPYGVVWRISSYI
ncbi:uncharacterized protein LOC107426657 [Ziziphus jujuba]|uniref:Uncharacterized protein LOC107426657 n=1 Tax=Ziziphus jujuba TaxID=326968 RepID=A0ABM3IX64_ZIZJJ|nr:uncharacterized protein LOC107426657 [Ziziphus jujuba]